MSALTHARTRAQAESNPFLGFDLVKRICTDGVLELEYDPRFLLTHVPIIKEGIRRMTNNPEHVEAFGDYVIDDDEVPKWKHNSGLSRRNDDENKWFFHNYEETCADLARRGAPVREYDRFFASMNDVTARGKAIAVAFMTEFDTDRRMRGHYPEFSETLEFKLHSGRTVTRILRYLPRKGTSADAKVHIDRNGVTIHWWSSREGLYVFDSKLAKRRVHETSHSHIAVFPGKKFAGVTNGEYGLGTPHGVRDSERAASDEDRFALVTFAHAQLSEDDVDNVVRRFAEFDALEACCIL